MKRRLQSGRSASLAGCCWRSSIRLDQPAAAHGAGLASCAIWICAVACWCRYTTGGRSEWLAGPHHPVAGDAFCWAACAEKLRRPGASAGSDARNCRRGLHPASFCVISRCQASTCSASRIDRRPGFPPRICPLQLDALNVVDTLTTSNSVIRAGMSGTRLAAQAKVEKGGRISRILVGIMIHSGFMAGTL